MALTQSPESTLRLTLNKQTSWQHIGKDALCQPLEWCINMKTLLPLALVLSLNAAPAFSSTAEEEAQDKKKVNTSLHSLMQQKDSEQMELDKNVEKRALLNRLLPDSSANS